MRLVSVVVPDWLIATTSVSAMSDRSPKPDSSVAGSASAARPDPAQNWPSAAAIAWPATAAVPCPITSTREISPDASAVRTAAGRASAPRLTARAPSRSTSLPRSVLRKLSGASVISLSRKWGNPARSMSRVVICARARSPSATGSGVPS